jgi:lipopolysaccharide transport system ATP-binding protein
MVNALKFEKSTKEDFWALKDVSFEVQQGQSVGIIGRNGAGKSTLLKILSKITPCTSGSIIARGRIASLLEVGTGFHPELTGRENIFFNGSLLGMRRKEIESKFDDIVDFSGVEKFLDTPLKHFSSGMQLRLAFAVAAFLEPEILIIDEVLAVGDIYFQQKCVQKMNQIVVQGGTMLFVSHNFGSVRSLCEKAIVLEAGKKIFEGSVDDAIDVYGQKKESLSKIEYDLSEEVKRTGKGDLRFDRFTFGKEDLHFGDEIVFEITLKSKVNKIFQELDFGINVIDKNGVCLIHLSNRFLNMEIAHTDDKCRYRFAVQNILKPGIFTITLFLRSESVIEDYILDAVQFSIADSNNYGYSGTENIQGAVLPEFQIQFIHV